MIDRKIAPESTPVSRISFVEPHKSVLSNGWEVWFLNAGTEEVVRVEWTFRAGSIYQAQTYQAKLTNKMLREGTKGHLSESLSEVLDYYGAFLQLDCDRDLASISLYVLNKHLENVLPIVKEVVLESIFPERELSILLRKEKQAWQVNEQKVSSVAQKRFPSLVFGAGHPYGRYGDIADFESITSEVLATYRDKQYQPANGSIVVSGKVPGNMNELLERYFGSIDTGKVAEIPTIVGESPINESLTVIEKEGAIQSAVMVGRTLFSKSHPDFAGMQVLNTVLGGYFGSRLMSNIREDKGYTYGIYSGVTSMLRGGYFSIFTEVGAEVTKDAMHEIFSELQQLRDDLIPNEELDLVRNYLLGAFLRSTDGPFAQGDRFMGVHNYGLGYDFYDQFIETVKTIPASRLQELAQQYLREEDMRQLVVGKY